MTEGDVFEVTDISNICDPHVNKCPKGLKYVCVLKKYVEDMIPKVTVCFGPTENGPFEDCQAILSEEKLGRYSKPLFISPVEKKSRLQRISDE